jgi:hypothetical protein
MGGKNAYKMWWEHWKKYKGKRMTNRRQKEWEKQMKDDENGKETEKKRCE